MKNDMSDRGDLPGDIIAPGDKIRFFWVNRTLRGVVTHVGDLVVTAETKSGRSYGFSRNAVREITQFGTGLKLSHPPEYKPT